MTWWERPGLRFAVGIEDTFVAQEEPGARKLDEYELTQHYQRWHSDLALITEAGADMVRWGIPWYRVNPAPRTWDFSWLDRVVDRYAELSITPIVDLMHYGTPLWLDNSFANSSYPDRVAEYGAAVAERYADRLSIYTPMNEPLLNVLYCGEYAEWPPYFRGEDGLALMLRRICEGITKTQLAIDEVTGGAASFVHVEASYRFGGDEDAEPDVIRHLRHRAYLVEDLVTGGFTADHPLAEWLLGLGFPESSLEWHRAYPVRPDVMGVNYYPNQSTEGFVRGEKHRGDLADRRPRIDGWTEGLEDVLTGFWRRYGAPVMLTETNVHDTDAKKQEWLEASVAKLRELSAAGVPIVGYTWWPLFDSVNWRYRHESAPVESYFTADGAGLWQVVPDSVGGLDRVPTALIERYRSLAAAYSHG